MFGGESTELEAEVAYYERSRDGFYERIGEFNVRLAHSLSLQDGIFAKLRAMEKLEDEDGDTYEYSCFGGNFEGRAINMQLPLQEIQYLQYTIRTCTKPMLYLYKQCRGRCDSGPERKPSTLVKTLVGGCDTDDEEAHWKLFQEILTEDLPQSPAVERSRKIGLPSSQSADAESHHPRKLARRSRVFHDDEDLENAKKRAIRRKSEYLEQQDCTKIEEQDAPDKPKSPYFHKDSIHGLQASKPPLSAPPQNGRLPSSESAMTTVHKSSTIQREHPWQKRQPITKAETCMTLPKLPREENQQHPDRVYHNIKRENSALERKGAMKRTKKTFLKLASFQLSSLKVETASGQCVTVECDNFTTIGDLRQQARQTLMPVHAVSEFGLILTYQTENGEVFELYNDSQFLSNTHFFDLFSNDTSLVLTAAISKLKKPDVSPKEEILMQAIRRLTGVQLDLNTRNTGLTSTTHLKCISDLDKEEVHFARRTLGNYITEICESRDALNYALSMEVANDDAPLTLSLLIPIGNLVPVTFRYKDVFSFTKVMNMHKKAEDVLAEILPCVVVCGLVEDNLDKYVLQISGEDSYIHGSHELIAFRKIRSCIMKGEAINLSLTEKPNLDLYRSHKFEYKTLDPLTQEPPTHSDLVASTQHISLWECNEDFSVKVVKAENLPFLQRSTFHVQVSLHHGFTNLSNTAKTSSKAADQYHIHWNEDIWFKIQLKHLPKAAKLVVKVFEGSARKQSSANKSQVPYHWGLISVFDHNGKLRQGSHTLQLWPGAEKMEDALDMNMAGPVANNHHHSAVTATIDFGSRKEIVYFPSVGKESLQPLFKRHQLLKNIQLRKAFCQYVQDKFASQDKPYHRLAKLMHTPYLDWHNLTHTLQVYILLEELEKDIENIPFYIALNLLDSDFPDENVRGFATRVLEQLPDEQLEDFLLQLTQVPTLCTHNYTQCAFFGEKKQPQVLTLRSLQWIYTHTTCIKPQASCSSISCLISRSAQALKFERCHDSALARFLLKRALRNKTIGHFLFWYLRSELHQPQYRARFAVILEAYLKGCGEAMMKRLAKQIGIQATLEEIGNKLKQDFDKDFSKMQQALIPLLKEKKLNTLSFNPIYNPKISVGKMKISKCKVMSSAKKPLWLEMQNVHPTSTSVNPVGVILKLGDDLRQDMITLKMLSLFEKLWAHQGLDLHLIPYGCIATGDKTGCIEVVKNAKTISEVSGVRNNDKLLEWIKSHQKNEFGEEDPDMVNAAIKRFTFSCAGYSVATYVLGIGDRHNDNIMVTTSGNLFHIDFGHFLGNIKRIGKFLKREWVPFVLTPDFVHVMGGEGSTTFETYKNLCCRAFLILRRNADLIINLFSMMRSTGLPELTCVEDTDYIKTALELGRTEIEAEASFRNVVIQKCLDLKWTVQAMWWIHTKAQKHRRS